MPRGKRAGLSQRAFLFFNCHGLDTAILDSFDFSRYSATFLCETWLHERTSTPKLQHKTFFHVPARKPGGRGRASGGLHLYVNPSLCARLLSSTDHHIAIQLPFVSIIGFYYQNTLDFDDTILDISTALASCPSHLPIIIGGDLNIHPTDSSFKDFCRILSASGITPISDPAIATFIGKKNSYRNDYVFASRSLTSATETVLDQVSSDHLPLLAKAKFSRCLRLPPLSPSVSQKLDMDTCINTLQNSSLLNLPDSDLPAVIDSIFAYVSSTSKRKSTPRKPWFDTTAYDLRSRCQALLLLSKCDNSYRQEYLLCRTAYHTHLRNSKKAISISNAENLVTSAKRKGIQVLYRHARPSVNFSSSIPLPDLASYTSSLLTDPNASVATTPIFPIPSCETETHPLLASISTAEVSAVLQQLRSKAKSASSIASPHDLNLLSDALAPLLSKVFNNCLRTSTFPSSWCESVFFFLHKKGSRSNPTNYRTICVENSFLKAFMSILAKRFDSYVEDNSLLPDCQFGFRRRLSCLSAASILYDLASSRLNSKLRTYACFVDFSKAFDTVNRPLLFQKLQLLGFPVQICCLLQQLYSTLQFRIRSDAMLSQPFTTSRGTPQGDPPESHPLCLISLRSPRSSS